MSTNGCSQTTDLNSSSVSLYLQGEGTNGSTTLTDSSSHAFSMTSSATNSTAQAKAGTGSIYFSGTTWISVPYASYLYLSGDFTIEAWVYMTANNASYPTIYRQDSSSYSPVVAGFNPNRYPSLVASFNGTSWGVNFASSTQVPLNTWTHIAWERYGNSWLIYQNGVQTASSVVSGTPMSSSNAAVIGAVNSGTYTFSGYMDEFRVTKGVARYTSNFSFPPSATTCSPGTYSATVCGCIFNYSGSTVNWGLPGNFTALRTWAWGGGGGGYAYDSTYGANGAAGGYVTNPNLAVTAGSALAINVAGGGGPSNGTTTPGTAGYSGGAAGGTGTGVGGSGGGGYSGIFNGSVSFANALLVAGGGGGSSHNFTGTTPNAIGGNGGGTSGTAGGGNGGGGGTSSGGGAAGTGATAGGQLAGGAGGTNTSGGGGGGGGYYGGGGGQASNANNGGGGGGGSSLTGTGGSTTAGSGTTVAGTTVNGYTAGVGAGGTYSAGTATAGGNGQIITSWGTVLLLHMDGTNGSTTFVDEMGHTVTPTNTTISTASPKMGTGATSNFNANSGYLSITGSDFDFGTGDFTIEAWIKFSTVTGDTNLIVGDISYTGPGKWSLVYNTTAQCLRVIGTGGAAFTSSGTWVPSAGTWYHVAVARQNGTTRYFVNGTQIGSNVADTNSWSSASTSIRVGATNDSVRFFNGYIDEVRVTKGFARYNGAFTVPNGLLP